MKKLFAIMLALMMVIFTGCTSENADNSKEESKDNKVTLQGIAEKDTKAEMPENNYKQEPESKSEDTNSDEEFVDETEESEDKAQEVTIDEGVLSLIGKTNDEVVNIKGELSETIWADGPRYRFGSENVWYGFDSYEIAEDSSYIPLGICNSLDVPLSMLLKAVEANAETLEKAIDQELIEGFNVMYECNTYSATYNGYSFIIYEDSLSNISGQSIVGIERE